MQSASYARPVTLTRRTPRFGELAAQVEERLDQLGIVVDPQGIDAGLREQVRATAEQLGVSDRTALRYVPDLAADELARQYVLMTRTLAVDRGIDITSLAADGPDAAHPEATGRRRGHLRLVR